MIGVFSSDSDSSWASLPRYDRSPSSTCVSPRSSSLSFVKAFEVAQALAVILGPPQIERLRGW